jgi:hypothetical protein
MVQSFGRCRRVEKQDFGVGQGCSLTGLPCSIPANYVSVGSSFEGKC